MAQQNLNVGITANDGTGDPHRAIFIKTEANFGELYAKIVAGVTFVDPSSIRITFADGSTLNTAFVIPQAGFQMRDSAGAVRTVTLASGGTFTVT